MAKMKVHAPEVSGQAARSAQVELTPEQKEARREFLTLKLEDLQARQEKVQAELESLK
jgi:hypothetical protein